MNSLSIYNLPIETMIKNLPTPVIITNHEGDILFINNEASVLYGYSEEELLSQSIFNFCTSTDESGVFQSILLFSIKLNEPNGRFMGKHKTKYNKIIEVDILWSSLKDTDDSFLVLCIDDITEEKRIEREYVKKVQLLEAEIKQRKKIERALNLTHLELKDKIAALETQKKINDNMLNELVANNEFLERLAMEDALTGIYNRRYFSEYLESEIIRARHLEEPISLLMIDLDHFKNINDSLGHLIGDKVLVSVVKRVQDAIGNQNILCRYGGEEFAVIALGIDGLEAKSLAKKIQSTVGDKPIVVDDYKVSITASIGVSSINPYKWKAPLEAIRDYIIKTADKALYRAKSTGRNKVETHSHAAEEAD